MITKKRKVANISMSRLLAPANALIRLVTFIAKKLCYNLFDVIHEASSVTFTMRENLPKTLDQLIFY